MDKFHQLQKEHDAEFWHHNNSDLEDVRHVTLHMGKLVGKLSTYCERKEHNVDHSADQIKDEVIPDLLFHALHLANKFNIKLDDQYLKRLAENKKRFRTATKD